MWSRVRSPSKKMTPPAADALERWLPRRLLVRRRSEPQSRTSSRSFRDGATGTGVGVVAVEIHHRPCLMNICLTNIEFSLRVVSIFQPADALLFKMHAAAPFSGNYRSNWIDSRQVCEFRLLTLREEIRVLASEFRLPPYIVQRDAPDLVVYAVEAFRMVLSAVACEGTPPAQSCGMTGKETASGKGRR